MSWDRAWRGAATVYLVGLPCLWWQGKLQDEALAVAYPVCTTGLLILTLGASRRRFCSPVAAWVAIGLLLSSLWHWPAHGFPLVTLYGLLGVAAVWSLGAAAPDAAWLERRIVWLAGVNAVYAWLQWAGWDPILDTVFEAEGVRQPVGLLSRRSQWGLVLLMAAPLARTWWTPMAFAVTAVMTGSWTAAGGIGLWAASKRLTPLALAWVAVGVVAVAVGLDFDGRVAVRLLAWRAVLEQVVWSPVWGYGLGVWQGQVPLFYNGYLSAWYTGGLLLVVPIMWAIWKVWGARGSPARTSLLWLAAAGMVQTPWDSLRVLVVGLALWVACELRRQDADQR